LLSVVVVVVAFGVIGGGKQINPIILTGKKQNVCDIHIVSLFLASCILFFWFSVRLFLYLLIFTFLLHFCLSFSQEKNSRHTVVVTYVAVIIHNLIYN